MKHKKFHRCATATSNARAGVQLYHRDEPARVAKAFGTRAWHVVSERGNWSLRKYTSRQGAARAMKKIAYVLIDGRVIYKSNCRLVPKLAPTIRGRK